MTHNTGLLSDGKAYLIDDRTQHGVEAFGERHIHFGSEKFPDWPHVVKFLLGGFFEGVGEGLEK